MIRTSHEREGFLKIFHYVFHITTTSRAVHRTLLADLQLWEAVQEIAAEASTQGFDEQIDLQEFAIARTQIQSNLAIRLSMFATCFIDSSLWIDTLLKTSLSGYRLQASMVDIFVHVPWVWKSTINIIFSNILPVSSAPAIKGPISRNIHWTFRCNSSSIAKTLISKCMT